MIKLDQLNAQSYQYSVNTNKEPALTSVRTFSQENKKIIDSQLSQESDIRFTELLRTIDDKNRQINSLNLAIEALRRQHDCCMIGKIQVITETLSEQGVQLLSNNTSFDRMNQLLKQKLRLFQQVTQRQYQQAQGLQKRVSCLQSHIRKLMQHQKAEESVNDIKLGNIRRQLTREKNLNKEARGEIRVLKALIKQLEEEDSEEEGGRKYNDIQHEITETQIEKQKTPLLQSDNKANFKQSCLNNNKKLHQLHVLHQTFNCNYSSIYQVIEPIQQQSDNKKSGYDEIVFM